MLENMEEKNNFAYRTLQRLKEKGMEMLTYTGATVAVASTTAGVLSMFTDNVALMTLAGGTLSLAACSNIKRIKTMEPEELEERRKLVRSKLREGATGAMIYTGVATATATVIAAASALTPYNDNMGLMTLTGGIVTVAATNAIRNKRKEAKNQTNSEEFSDDSFDIENQKAYSELIKKHLNSSWYIENGYGNPQQILLWDEDFLRYTSQLIAYEHQEDLIESNEDYTNYGLVSSLVNGAMIYALENDEYEVGPSAIVSAIKNNAYIPEETKIEILDTISKEKNLDCDFGSCCQNRQYQKRNQHTTEE